MNKSHKSFSVAEYKIKASILLKTLHSHDANSAMQAAKRFKRLPEFSKTALDQIIHADIKHKHALSVIALEKGFATWSDLKCQLPFIRGGFLNNWFNSYQEAKNFQSSQGGYLLPFKNQFIVCTADYINALSFDSNDSDWQTIQYDWVHPENKSAWQRLYQKWMKIQGGQDD